MFFFSSRRRHTRSTRDWSSDVCSSDLSVQSGLLGSTVWNGLSRASPACDTTRVSQPPKTEPKARFAKYRQAWRNALTELFARSEEHTSELQSRVDLVCRLLLEKKK